MSHLKSDNVTRDREKLCPVLKQKQSDKSGLPVPPATMINECYGHYKLEGIF